MTDFCGYYPSSYLYLKRVGDWKLSLTSDEKPAQLGPNEYKAGYINQTQHKLSVRVKTKI
jgi:hypothetical protein